MIETPDGVTNMDQIMQVEGVDAIYVGPADLGLSHGMQPTLGVPNDSEHERLVLSILEGCNRNGVTPGIHTDSVTTAARWRQAGFRMLTVSTDGALMRKAASQTLNELRGAPKLPTPAGSQYG
jgi:4-hydroxy-2-oxoheptanedioate aldolase